MTPEQIEAGAKAAFGFYERTFRWESISHRSQEYWRNTAHAALIAAEAKAWSKDMTKAPKKKHLDLWDGEKRRTDCFWSVDRWYQLVIGFGIEVKATHWRLPPAPPEAG